MSDKIRIEDLQVELEEDMKIDAVRLQAESAQIPVTWAKWLRHHSNAKKKLIQLSALREALIKDRMLFYSGRHDKEMCDVVYSGTTELKIAINGDPEVVKNGQFIQYYEMVAEFTGKALDVIKNKGYSIKNMIEIRKLENGA